MLNKALENELRKALSDNYDFTSARNILAKYKNHLPRETIHKLLESMRANVNDVFDDRVLELMDITSGFCSPPTRIW